MLLQKESIVYKTFRRIFESNKLRGVLSGWKNYIINQQYIFYLNEAFFGNLKIARTYPLNTWSQNLLEILTTDYQPETYVLPTDLENKKVRARPVISKISSDQKLYVYPNPANTHYVARYSIPETTKNASLRILTIEGKLINDYPLIGFDNEKVIRINDLPEAVYITELIADGKRIANIKLTIVH